MTSMWFLMSQIHRKHNIHYKMSLNKKFFKTKHLCLNSKWFKKLLIITALKQRWTTLKFGFAWLISTYSMKLTYFQYHLCIFLHLCHICKCSLRPTYSKCELKDTVSMTLCMCTEFQSHINIRSLLAHLLTSFAAVCIILLFLKQLLLLCCKY